MKSRLVLSLTLFAFSTIAPRMSRAQDVTDPVAAGLRSGVLTGDGITLTVNVETPGTVIPVVKAGITFTDAPCSTKRACGPVFDLRAKSIIAPALIANDVAVPVVVVVENAGKVASPAAEIAICREMDAYGKECGGRGPMVVVNLPSLAPGQTATITQPVLIHDVGARELQMGAVVDPENMLGEKQRANNAVSATSPTRVDVAKLELMDSSKPSRAEVRFDPRAVGTFMWKVRNPASLAVGGSSTILLTFRKGPLCGLRELRVPAPAIQPHAVVTITLVTPPVWTGCVLGRDDTNVGRWLQLDAENKGSPWADLLQPFYENFLSARLR
jgi:hypothetical protein